MRQPSLYFFLNVEDDFEFNKNRMPVSQLLNERVITIEKYVLAAMNEMKAGKVLGLNGFRVNYLKKGVMTVAELLVRLLNKGFDRGAVPIDRHGAFIVPLLQEEFQVNSNS